MSVKRLQKNARALILFCLGRGETREKNLSTLHFKMGILISGLGVLVDFELKCNFSDSTVYNTGNSGNMHSVILTF